MRLRSLLTVLSLLCVGAIAGCGGNGGEKAPAGAPNDASTAWSAATSRTAGPWHAWAGAASARSESTSPGSTSSPTPDSGFDWDAYDKMVGSAARNGVRVFATVFSSPTWAEPTPETPPLNGGNLAGFQYFAAAAAQRYGSDGDFWREHPDLPKLPVRDWQLWNEPNSPLFWKPAPDPKGYLTVLRAFYDAVKRATR